MLIEARLKNMTSHSPISKLGNSFVPCFVIKAKYNVSDIRNTSNKTNVILFRKFFIN